MFAYRKAGGLLVLCVAVLCALSLMGCSSPENEPEVPRVSMGVSSSYPAYTIEELTNYSNIVVSGEVVGYSDPFLIKPATGGDPMYHTDMYVKVHDVFKGDPLCADPAVASKFSAKDPGGLLVTVRFMGGSGDAFDFTSDEEPGLAIGENALLFLYRVADGSDYNTEGSHYYLVTGPNSVYTESEDGSYACNGDTVTKADICAVESSSAIVSDEADGPVDPNLQNAGVRSLEDQLDVLEQLNEAGEITDSDLAAERERAEAAKESYSQILSEEEARQYEQDLLARLNEQQ